MKTVGIIPARGGSKGIIKKNLRSFCGKPLLAWTIISALKSNLDRVIVSTDNLEIARVAKKYGAEAIMRPSELAIDSIGIEPTLKHVYEWLIKNESYKADGIALLHSTNPFRQTFHINKALNLFKKSGADSVVAVNQTPANHTPYWTLVRSPHGKVTLWGNVPLKRILTRRQDFPLKCYARNDLIYVLKPRNLFSKERADLYGERVELYDTGTFYEMDINTLEEWEEAEIKFKKFLKKQGIKYRSQTSRRQQKGRYR